MAIPPTRPRSLTRHGIAPLLGVALALAVPATASAALPDPGSSVDLLTDANIELVSASQNDARTQDLAGYSVASAGDVNKDGYADVVVGAPKAGGLTGTGPGEAYVVFGAETPSQVDLGTLGTSGFTITGRNLGDELGASVSGAGDVNGDGYGDVIVGAPQGESPPDAPNSGAAYIVFGSATPADVAVDSIGSAGMAIHGLLSADEFGAAVSGAGDVNGDGFADVIAGAPGSDIVTNDSGASYVIFGSATPAAEIAVRPSLGAAGFQISGFGFAVGGGNAVSDAGDVNKDGFADVVVGASKEAAKGAAYLVLGSMAPSDTEVSSAVRIDGAAASDEAGHAVSGAGDVNGDGFADVLIGAPKADSNGATDAGAAYLYYGSGAPANADASSLDATGVIFHGAAAGDHFGTSVSGAGDVNGDGFADVLVGAPDDNDEGAGGPKGSASLILGSANAVDVSVDALGTGGITVNGAAEEDSLGHSVAGAGDVNKDGRADVLLGAPFIGGSASGATGNGGAYILLAQAPTPPPPPPPPPAEDATTTLAAKYVARKRSFGAGGKVSYRVVVRNTGKADAKGVRASITLPKGLGIGAKSRRKAVSNTPFGLRKRTLRWNLGDIDAGARKVLTVRLTASRLGWGRRLSRLTVAAENAETVRARRVVVVTSAGLRARLSAPRAAALRRGLLRYRVRVTNTSKTTAWNVTAVTRLPRKAVSGRSVKRARFAAIKPGATKRYTVTYRVNPKAKGRARASLRVRASNARAVARGRTTRFQ